MKTVSIIGGIGFICLAFFLALSLSPMSATANVPGVVDDALLKIEGKRCGKAPSKSRCWAQAKSRANKRLNALRQGTEGLYGFRLPEKLIPESSGQLLWHHPRPAVSEAAGTAFVLYSSRTYPGSKKTAVSGTVSWPRGKPPAGGWPIISWAHGTTGLADQCAPSRGVDGSYGGAEPLISHWLGQGYAVLATDYSGLGTPGVHPYLIGPAAARSVLDIINPARQLLGKKINNKVFLTGHSQGGHATLFSSSLAQQRPEINLRGSVAYAPPALLTAQADLIDTQPADAYGLSALAMSILRGAQEGDSRIDAEQLLLPGAWEQYPKTETLCLDQLGQELQQAGVGPRDLLQADWQESASGQYFMSALEEAHPALPISGQLLLLQGLQDQTVLPMFTNALRSDLQALNPGKIEYRRYSSLDTSPADGLPDDGADFLTTGPADHSAILSQSQPLVDQWLQTRK